MGLGSIKGNLCVDGIGVFDRRRWIVSGIDERMRKNNVGEDTIGDWNLFTIGSCDLL